MSTLVQFPDRRREMDQAALWIVRIDRGLRDGEREELSRWVEGPRHRAALLEVAELWDRMDVLAELGELFPLPEHNLGKRDTRKTVMWLAAAAASVLLGVALTVFHVRSDGHFTQSYTTAVGEQKTVELPDHSKILLNTDTDLQVEFSATARLIRLSHGEANFEVAKNPARPFTVRAAGIDFVAVGTAFNVRTDPVHGVSLTVTEGRVHVQRTLLPESVVLENAVMPKVVPDIAKPDIDVVVAANSGVVIDPAVEKVSALEQAEVNEATAWQQGMVVFERTPLLQVAAEFNRYLATPIVIADPQLADLRVTGFFRVGDIDGLSLSLRRNFAIDVHKEDDVIRLSASQ